MSTIDENGHLRRLNDEQLKMIQDSSEASLKAKMAATEVLALRKTLRGIASNRMVHPSVRRLARERLQE